MMPKCYVCERKAHKRIVVGNYALSVCKPCARRIQNGVGTQLTFVDSKDTSGPKADYGSLLALRENIAGAIEASEIAVVCIWRYPHSDWPLAVSSGLTDLPSYQSLLDRLDMAKDAAEEQGAVCVVVEMGVQAMFDLLASEGMDNTGQNRAELTKRLGFEQYHHGVGEV